MGIGSALRRAAKTVVDSTEQAEGTIEYVSTGGYNTSTGMASSGPDSSSTVRGVIESYTQDEIDGSTVLREDLKWTVPAFGISRPRKNDLASIAGETDAEGDATRHTIRSVKPIYGADVVVMYELQLRR